MRPISRLTYPLVVLEVLHGLQVGPEFFLLEARVHPLVSHDVLEGGSLGRVEHEELLEEILAVS